MIWSVPVGRFMVYAIKDGVYHTDPLAAFPDSDAEDWDGERLTDDGMLRIELGCFLVSDGDRFVLVDSGLGRWPDAPAAVRPTTGLMPESLKSVGVEPGQVEMVIHTHLHADHFGGDVTDTGEPFFPNARIVAHSSDLKYYRKAEGWLGDRVRDEFVPLVEAGLVDLLDGPKTLVPGIAVQMSPGHTPGHMSVLIDSEESHVLVVGDVMHHPHQVQHPEWRWEGDLDPEQAVRTRKQTVGHLARSRATLAANHFSHPPFGLVGARDGSPVFEPLNSSTNS